MNIWENIPPLFPMEIYIYKMKYQYDLNEIGTKVGDCAYIT